MKREPFKCEKCGILLAVSAIAPCPRLICSRCENKELKAQIDAFWSMLANLWDIEPREYFEAQIAKGIGYENSPLAMACHYMHKRDRKESCWHCGVVLVGDNRPRCYLCPPECDGEGCDEMGCQPPETAVLGEKGEA